MPFTPFHLGPAALVKAALARRFSFLVFGVSQVLIDIEPLVRILRHDDVLHGPTHSFVGAVVLAPVAALIGRAAGWAIGPRISLAVALGSALIGTTSHVVLDAVMHGDMHPFWPFSVANPLLGLVSVRDLHLFCLASAVAGGAILGVRAWAGSSHRRRHGRR